VTVPALAVALLVDAVAVVVVRVVVVGSNGLLGFGVVRVSVVVVIVGLVSAIVESVDVFIELNVHGCK
jgi:hypothetical protein